MEKRRFSRVFFMTDVVVTSGATTTEAQETDLSLGGIYVRTPHRIPVYETVEVRIVMPEADSPCSISARAVVVRHDDQGMGLASRSMDFESFFILTQLVSEALGDRTRAAREVLDFLQNPPGDEERPFPSGDLSQQA